MKNLSYLNSIISGILPFITLIWLLNGSCSAQIGNFTYKSVPRAYLPSATELAPYQVKANNAKVGAYDLTQSLPQGYVTDGSVDYTAYLQQGINNNLKVIFPDFPVLVNVKGLSLIGNSTVVFAKKSKIVLQSNESGNYQILRIFNIQNVTIYFPVIQGDRKNHLGNKGEWGMGIFIGGASNIEIVNPKISECWGDGIYIGKNIDISRNIKIDYAVLDDNRRNGISIVSVDGLTLVHPLVCNTNGTEPMAGIDVEPNGGSDSFNNILIDNPITFNSSNYGIVISFWGLLGKVDKEANMIIKNHVDDHSSYAFLYHSFRNNNENNSLVGHIQVINPVWKNNKTTFQRLGFSKNGPNLEFKNVSIINNKSGKNIVRTDSLNKIKKSLMNDNKVIFH